MLNARRHEIVGTSQQANQFAGCTETPCWAHVAPGPLVWSRWLEWPALGKKCCTIT